MPDTGLGAEDSRGQVQFSPSFIELPKAWETEVVTQVDEEIRASQSGAHSVRAIMWTSMAL